MIIPQIERPRMKNKIMYLVIITILNAQESNSNIPASNPEIEKTIVEYIDKESSFNYNNDEYKLIVNGVLETNSYYLTNELFLMYKVFKNGNEIQSNDEHNFIYTKCNYENGGPFEDHYEIDVIKNDNSLVHTNDSFGWILYTAGICGNTFSYQTEIIIPPINTAGKLLKSNQLFKSKPNVIFNNSQIDIFYSFQEWNFAGTLWSELIPQKITYNINDHKLIDNKIEIKDFPHLIFDFTSEMTLDLSINFTSLFMSGFNDMNIELMQYAIDNLYNPEHVEEWYNYFYGAAFEHQRELYYDKTEGIINMFIWGMITHYGHTDIKWLHEFYTVENGFVYHENEAINTEHNYIRLTDCSKENFQSVVDRLR